MQAEAITNKKFYNGSMMNASSRVVWPPSVIIEMDNRWEVSQITIKCHDF